ncbi:MAG: DUF3237 domain-containing protein [Leucobacter sp.]
MGAGSAAGSAAQAPGGGAGANSGFGDPGPAAPQLEPVCEVIVELGEPRDFGRTRDGLRRFTPILGGELRGIPGSSASAAVQALRAEILPGGGDRQLVRDPGPAYGAGGAEGRGAPGASGAVTSAGAGSADTPSVPGVVGDPAASTSAGARTDRTEPGDLAPAPAPPAVTTVEIDARYDARTADGALIGMHATGLRRVEQPPVAAAERSARADPAAPGAPDPAAPRVYFRVVLRFEASDPALAELQDALYVADGVREADRVTHTVYRVH